jgi:hypothetical protein
MLSLIDGYGNVEREERGGKSRRATSKESLLKTKKQST